MKITFPDGKSKEFADGSSALDIAKSISEGLAREVVAVEIDGELKDASLPIKKDAKINLIKFSDDAGRDVFWHSSAHILAQAITRLYPKAKLTIGPVIESGFYYDVDFGKESVKEEDLEKIEKEMKKIVDEKLTVSRKGFNKSAALKLFEDNEYKQELIKEADADTFSVYIQGEFSDLCRGPHVPNTGMIKSFKLTKIAGAYWRGDADNKQLTRIYGVSFPDKKLLKDYMHNLEEAAKRDHRKIGKDMDLFVFSDLVGSGTPLYTPRGFQMRQAIIEYSRELNDKIGYKEVHTPNFNKAELFKISGHYEKFKDDMVHVKSNYSKEEFFMKPMNCPQHTQIFASKTRSYKDMPVKYSDFANLCRDEKPGELSGLTRLKVFSQDDAHCFCTEAQVEHEFELALSAINEALKTYEMKYYIRLSLWDPNHKENYLGDEAVWEKSQDVLRKLLIKNKIEFKEEEGEAAFYGPKMDIMVRDALNREWQISTIQLDFNMPKRFELKYEGEDGKQHTPVMIHRAIIGSPERFMGILIEHYGGKFPLWLNPNQVRVLPIADRHIPYAQKIAEELHKNNIKVEIDTRVESVPKKVREAQLQQFNYILVVGDQEAENKTANVRTRDTVVHGEQKISDLITTLLQEIKSKKN